MNFERSKIDTSFLPDVVKWKWDRTVLDEGFVPLPKRLLRSARKIFKGPSRMGQMVTMLTIVDYERPGKTKLPSLDFLAFIAGMKKTSFKKYLDELEELELIKVVEQGDRLKITYEGLLKEIANLTKE